MAKHQKSTEDKRDRKKQQRARPVATESVHNRANQVDQTELPEELIDAVDSVSPEVQAGQSPLTREG